MKKIITSLALLLTFACQAQYASVFHPSTFKKFKGIMRSNPYKGDDWEKPFMKACLKAVFPLDVQKNPSLYADSFIHWIGIVKDVVLSDSNGLTAISFTLEHKHWDYIEDYSIQDEIMFVSPLGEGDFIMQVPAIQLTEEEKETIKNMAANKTLLFCYGKLQANPGLPVMTATGIKVVDYKYYSTKIFSYDIQRDADGNVVLTNGVANFVDHKMLMVAHKGQNKD